MTEAGYTSGVVNFLKNAGTITFKHCDRFTTAIPDVSSTARGMTTWLEMKLLKRSETLFDRVNIDKLQLFNMVALSTLGSAYYILVKNGLTFIVHPKFFVAPYHDSSEFERVAVKQFASMSFIPPFRTSLKESLDYLIISFPASDYKPIAKLVGV